MNEEAVPLRTELARLGDNLTHDLNNLLALIQGCAEEIRDESLVPASTDAVASILDAVERSAALTRMIGAVMHRLAPNWEEIELDAFVDTIRHEIERVLPEGVGLETDLANVGAVGIPDKVVLETAVLEMVGAVGSGMAGGERLAIAARAVDRLRDDGSEPRQFASLTVRRSAADGSRRPRPEHPTTGPRLPVLATLMRETGVKVLNSLDGEGWPVLELVIPAIDPG